MRALLVMMVLVFSFSCLAQSQDAPKNIPPVSDKAKGADKTKTKSERQNAIPAPPVNVVVSNTANAHTEGEKNEGQHEATNYAEWLVAIATAVLAGVTVGLVYYTKRLWGSTKVLAGDAKQSSEQQLRAYVFAGHDNPISLHKEIFPSVQIDIKNFGQTPANEVICRASIGVYPYPLTAKLVPDDAPSPSSSPLAPSQTIKQFPTLESPLTNAHLDAILAKRAAIYVWGKITYKDIFSITRHTTFCLYCTGEDIDGGSLAYYPDGNDAT